MMKPVKTEREREREKKRTVSAPKEGRKKPRVVVDGDDDGWEKEEQEQEEEEERAAAKVNISPQKDIRRGPEIDRSLVGGPRRLERERKYKCINTRTKSRLARDERELSSVWFRAFLHQSHGVFHELFQRGDGDVRDFHFFFSLSLFACFSLSSFDEFSPS